MILKKILILPVGFILIHVLYIGCCKCIEGNFHREISSLRAFEYTRSNLNTIDTVRVTDTLYSDININYVFIAKNIVNPISQFVNAAYATSCNCGGLYTDSGFRYKIDSLVITSNNTFKGIPAGQNISGYFTAIYTNLNNNNVTYFPLPQFIDSLNVNKKYSQINLFANPGNLTDKIHRLKYALYTNGKNYEITSTKVVVWQ
jgi:hypothetical protein